MTLTKSAALAGALRLALLGLPLLSGCSKDSSGDAAATNAAPAGPVAAVSVADLPHLKAGYWQRTETTGSGKPLTRDFCSSGAPISPPKLHEACSRVSYSRTLLGAYVIDATCLVQGITSQMHMKIAGDFGASFTSDSQMTISPMGQPPKTFSTHAETRYIGPCPASARPED